MDNIIKCDICGKEVDVTVERLDGLPPMLGFLEANGNLINICAECIMEKGREVSES